MNAHAGRRCAQRVRGHRGFTLIEVMAAVVVLAVGIAGVMGFIAKSSRFISDARNATVQACLARSVMVNVENLFWRKQADEVEESGDFGSDFPDYRFEVAIVEEVDEKAPGLCEVDVTVFRKTSGGNESAYKISTYLLDFRK